MNLNLDSVKSNTALVTCMRVMTSSTGDALTERRVSASFVDRRRGGTSSSSTRRRPRLPAEPAAAATDRQRRRRDDRRTGDADDDEHERSAERRHVDPARSVDVQPRVHVGQRPVHRRHVPTLAALDEPAPLQRLRASTGIAHGHGIRRPCKCLPPRSRFDRGRR